MPSAKDKKAKRGRGRPPKYNPVEIGLKTVQIIRTLGVDCAKADVAAAFYDSEFSPNREGERKRLLDSSLRTRKAKAKRKRQLVAYSELLRTHCPDFDELRAAVALSPMGLMVWLHATTDAKKKGKEIPAKYRLTNQELSKRKKARN